MKPLILVLIALATAVGAFAFTSRTNRLTMAQEAAPIYGITIPPGYRAWTMISAALVGAPINDLRVKLGNDVAIKASSSPITPRNAKTRSTDTDGSIG
ncbi:MAG TPA: hypothetical protein VF088_16025 [Pyrinomonadaceae bacterium]